METEVIWTIKATEVISCLERRGAHHRKNFFFQEPEKLLLQLLLRWSIARIQPLSRVEKVPRLQYQQMFAISQTLPRVGRGKGNVMLHQCRA